MDKRSFCAGIAIGKAMKGWSRAPAKGEGFGNKTIALVDYVAPFFPTVATGHATLALSDNAVGYQTTVVTEYRTTSATYSEVT